MGGGAWWEEGERDGKKVVDKVGVWRGEGYDEPVQFVGGSVTRDETAKFDKGADSEQRLPNDICDASEPYSRNSIEFVPRVGAVY